MIHMIQTEMDMVVEITMWQLQRKLLMHAAVPEYISYVACLQKLKEKEGK